MTAPVPMSSAASPGDKDGDSARSTSLGGLRDGLVASATCMVTP